MFIYGERSRFDLTSTAKGGEPSSLGDIADTTFEAMRVVDNANSSRIAHERAYDDRIDGIFQATGQRLENPERVDIRHKLAKHGSFGPMQGEYPDPHAEFQTKLNELSTELPQFRDVIAPDRPIRADALKKARDAEHKALDVWERADGGFSSWAARLAGGFYGAMHDPVNVATLMVGPTKPAQAGIKGLLWMGLKQGAANAGTEAMIQPFIQAWRGEAGLDHGVSLAAMNIGLAGLFGFGADAAVRSTIRGGRRLAGRPYRGPDPVPPIEALDTVAKVAPPESVLRRAADGDEQALRDLARETGQDNDPLIKYMLDEVEAERLFPVPDRVDGGEHLSSLARAVREASGAVDDLPTGDAIMPTVTREMSKLADEAVGEALQIEGKAVGFRSIDPREIEADPNTFQFKSGGNEEGVTDRLRGVTRWDPVSAGKAIVFERADGKLIIADGHQRRNLALRSASQGQEARLDAYVFREADGWTPEDVRAYAALKNMRESSGNALDMAQVMRERPDLIDGSLPLSDAKLREATMLARLSPAAFDAVLAGRLPPGYAALIGESVTDTSRHIGLLDELAEAGLSNSQQARLYLKQLLDLPTTTEIQHTLFGEEAFTRTVFRERVKVLDAALKTLRSDKRIFSLLEREAASIEGLGNVLAREANQIKADKAALLGELIERLATSRGMVATILNDAASSVARGYNPTLASRAFVARIADTLDRDGINGLLRADDRIEADLNPRPMEDPMGPEAKAQTDEVEAILATSQKSFDWEPKPEAPAQSRQLVVARDGVPQVRNVADFRGAVDDLKTRLNITTKPRREVPPGEESLFALPSLTELVEKMKQGSRLGLVADHVRGFKQDTQSIIDIAEQHVNVDVGRMSPAERETFLDSLSDLQQIVQDRLQVGYRVIEEIDEVDGIISTAFDKSIDDIENVKSDAESILDDMSDSVNEIDDVIALLEEGGDLSAISRAAAVENEDVDLGKVSEIVESGLSRYAMPEYRDVKSILDVGVLEASRLRRIVESARARVDELRAAETRGKTAVDLEDLQADIGEAAYPASSVNDQAGALIDVLLTKRDEASAELNQIKEGLVIPDIERMEDLADELDGRIAEVEGQEAKALADNPDVMFALRGFYSPAIRAAESISQAKGTGEQFWKQITKVPGVRKDELDWMGLEEFLKDKPSITKAEVLEFMRAHQVELDERVLGGSPEEQTSRSSISLEKLRNFTRMDEDELPDGAYADIEHFRLGKEQAFVVYDLEAPGGGAWIVLDETGAPVHTAANRETAVHVATGLVSKDVEGATKFEGYKVPGGTGYRELLIRLPELEGGKKSREWQELTKQIDAINDQVTADPSRYKALEDEYDRLTARRREIERTPGYESKHFHDQEIVHLRVDDRTGPNGEKVLFVNEIQSDLLQAARRFGFGDEGVAKAKAKLDNPLSPEKMARLNELQRRDLELTQEGARQQARSPFITSDEVLDEKQQIFDELIALEREANAASDPARRYLGTFGEGGAPKVPFSNDTAVEIAVKRALLYAAEGGYDAVSWARSDQIAKAVGAQQEDLALQYDSKIGKFLDKYTRKWGGKVEAIPSVSGAAKWSSDLGIIGAQINDMRNRMFSAKMQDQIERATAFEAQLRALEAKRNEMFIAAGDTNPLLRITPEMRASVLEGQPLSVPAQARTAGPATEATVRAEIQPTTKIVGDDGQPLGLYHGTGSEFDQFDPSKNLEGGIFLSPDASIAIDYDFKGKSPRLIKAYADIRNPKIIDAGGEDFSDAMLGKVPDGEDSKFTVSMPEPSNEAASFGDYPLGYKSEVLTPNGQRMEILIGVKDAKELTFRTVTRKELTYDILSSDGKVLRADEVETILPGQSDLAMLRAGVSYAMTNPLNSASFPRLFLKQAIDQAKAEGYDGLWLRNGMDMGREAHDQIVAFHPDQVRIVQSEPATLRSSALSENAAAQMADIRAEIDKAVSRSLPVGWRAEVRERMVFGDLPEGLQRRNPGVPPSLEIEGTFDPYEKIIFVSLAALDPVERAYEEAGHALKALRLVPEADYGILRAKALEVDARTRFNIDERYGEVYNNRYRLQAIGELSDADFKQIKTAIGKADAGEAATARTADDKNTILGLIDQRLAGETFGDNVDAILDRLANPPRLAEALEEEAIMQMVAARARGDDFGKPVNAIMDKLIKFFRAIRDMLGLKGFRSFDDVFEDMTGGGFAQQMDSQSSTKSGKYGILSARKGAPNEQAPQNSPASGREGGEADAGQSASGGTAGLREGVSAAGRGDAGFGLRSRAFDRILRQASAGLDAEGNVFAGRRPRAGETGVDGAKNDDPQRVGTSEPYRAGKYEGSVTAKDLDETDIDQGNLARLYYEVKGKATEETANAQLIQRSDGAWEVEFVKVSDDLRGKGVANTLYNSIEKDLGIRMSPSGILSDDGLYFWQKRSPASVQWHEPVGAFHYSPKRISDQLRYWGQEIERLTKGEGTAANLSSEELAASLANAKAERGKFFKLWAKLPSEAKAAKDSMFAIDNAPKPIVPPSQADADFLQKAAIVSEAMFALGNDKSAKMPGGKAAKQIRELINGAAARGELSREDADALIKRYDSLERQHKDADKAKAQLAQEIDADAAHRKRQKALSEAARVRAEATLVRFRDARGQADPAKAMVAMIENLGQHELPEGTLSVANHQRAIFGLAMADLDAMLHEHRKTIITGQTRDKAGLRNVVRELFREETGDEKAKAFAIAASGVMEKLRQRFNAGGGAIGQRQDWGLPQAHDQVALIRAGKEAWINYIAPLLDAERMRHPLTGNPLTQADLKTSLSWIYDNIVSDGWHEKEAKMAFQGLGSIANQRGDQRFLVFRNADSWMKYADQFGNGGDPLAVMVNHIRGMSEDIAAMEVLGPNPRAMLTYMQQFVEQQAARRAAKLPAVFPAATEVTGREFRPHGNKFTSRDPREYARRMIERSNNMWDIYRGATGAQVGDTLAEVSQTVRNVNVATKLGSATLSALADPFWQLAARKFAGLPVTKVINDAVRQLVPGGEREARRAGVIADTYLHMHNEQAREAASLSATKVSGFLAERVISLSMLGTVTRAGNHAMSMGIQGFLADQTGKAFGELDGAVQRLLRRHGLAEGDWDAIRLDANGSPVAADFLTPSLINDASKARGGDSRLAERYLAMTIYEAQYATTTGTLRAKAMALGNTRAGTGVGEIWRHLAQFKSFAINIAILQIERMAREFVSQGLWRGAQYGAYALMAATLGGAMVIQLKQLKDGKDPRDMTKPEFWGNAMYQSGGLSIWGDLLYASENRMGGGIAGTIAGPTASTVQDLINVTYGAALKKTKNVLGGKEEDTNFGREAAKTVRNYVPGGSIWYLRMAWNRVLMDNLQRTLDPQAEAAFRRQIQNAKKNYRQDMWWKPGRATPSRAPDLSAAIPALAQ
jgi:hypothetical protein